MRVKNFLGVILALLFSLPLVGCKEDELQKQIDGLTATVGQLNGTIDELNGKIDGLTTTNEELSDRIEELEWAHNAPYYFRPYSLEKATEIQIISQEDLLNIAYYYNGGTRGNEELMGKNYQPQPLGELDEETQRKLQESIAFWERKDGENSSLKWKDVEIIRYFGTYTHNGKEVVALLYDEGYMWATGGPDDGYVFNEVRIYHMTDIQIRFLIKN